MKHDGVTFACPCAANGEMTIDEINAAIEAIRNGSS